MTKFICFTAFLLHSILCFAQTSYLSRPQTNQLYPRNIATNTASVTISGTITSSGFLQIKIKLYRNGVQVLPEVVPQPANIVGSGFSFSIPITAEQAQYKFVRSLETSPGVWSDADIADNVVAGDAIMIQGQSNAGASQNWSHNPITLPDYGDGSITSYIRVLGSASPTLDASGVAALQWFVGDGNVNPDHDGNTGQWGYVLAYRLIQSKGIPVAIFNGADGGKGISFFTRNSGNPGDLSTNYGRLYQRIYKGGFQNSIRAIFWFQGESDADPAWAGEGNPDENLNSYKTKWNALYNGWKTDFPTSGQRFYIHQIRAGCNGAPERTKFLNEALRQLAVDHSSDTRIYGTGALMQEPDGPTAPDFCHYLFSLGYEKLGNDWSRVLLQDLYGDALPSSSTSPQVISVNKPSANTLTLTFANDDPLTIEPSSLNYFYYTGTADIPAITGSSFSDRTLTLTLSSIPVSATGLGYGENHTGTNGPDIVTATNRLSIINFENMPIILGAFPVKLLSFGARLKDAQTVDLNWTVTDEKDLRAYEILYSTDGRNFDIIGTVKAVNAVADHQYTFRHSSRLSAVNYYRLKMVDIDESVNYSAIVTVKEKADANLSKLMVSPNPVINDAVVYIESVRTEKVEIMVFNSVGQKISTLVRSLQAGSNVVIVPRNKLQGQGIYIVRVKLGDALFTSRFVLSNR
jgi:hypothetical protein